MPTSLVDIAVRNRHVSQHEIGKVKPFQHLADDQGAGFLIGADRFIAERLDGRNVTAIPKCVKIDFGRSASSFGLGRLAAIGHDHETHRHVGDPSIPQLSGVEPVNAAGLPRRSFHEVMPSAWTIPALAIPQGDEGNLFVAKPRCRLQHPSIIALVGVLVGQQRSPLSPFQFRRPVTLSRTRAPPSDAALSPFTLSPCYRAPGIEIAHTAAVPLFDSADQRYGKTLTPSPASQRVSASYHPDRAEGGEEYTCRALIGF